MSWFKYYWNYTPLIIRYVDNEINLTGMDKQAETCYYVALISEGTPEVPVIKGFDPDELQDHFDKHGQEFRATSEAHYEDLAIKFLSSKLPGTPAKCGYCPTCQCLFAGTIHECVIYGDIVRWNSATDEFAVLSPIGYIRTYMMPKPEYHNRVPNVRYFHNRCTP